MSSSTSLTATYGSPSSPLAFTILASSPGYSGILKPLCAQFIWKHGGDFRVRWVASDCGGAGVVEEDEDGVGFVRLSEGEGARVAWDRMVLVGPMEDPAGLGEGIDVDVRRALRRILVTGSGGLGWRFFSRGPITASFDLERRILDDIGLEMDSPRIETHSVQPLSFLALVAKENNAYALVTRSVFLIAMRDGLIPNLRVYVEGGRDLLCPIHASVVPGKREEGVGDRLAKRFVEWLGEGPAQGIWSGYGRVWELGLPLFTREDREEVAGEEGLVRRVW